MFPTVLLFLRPASSLPIVYPPRLLALPRDALLRHQTVIFLLRVDICRHRRVWGLTSEDGLHTV